ncbi:hypothetical protein DMC30DRAFT_418360 [Rhodotorula diobovata]|uniref:Actin cortical patch SUR7/pH-response regulator pali n=1 Tax=Rhodotorula diobovata TaxID=5288 RepID=A0A5C5FQP5_9BASI|nr:hypothetical protein DMC30DRAFT_418360 [Rhodotorula diobovata]
MKGLLALYLLAFATSWTTLSLDLASMISGPKWITTRTPKNAPVELTTHYGLFEQCTSSSYEPGVLHCRPFPQRGVDCSGSPGRREEGEGGGNGLWAGVLWLAGQAKEGEKAVGAASGGGKDDEDEAFGFCDAWRIAGYGQQLSLVFALTNLIALTLTLLGTAAAGRGFRTEKLRSGWKLVAGLMVLQAACMCLSSSLVAYEFHHGARFTHGSKLGRAWVETVVAYALNLFIVIVLLLARATRAFRIAPGVEDGYEPIDDRRDVVA